MRVPTPPGSRVVLPSQAKTPSAGTTLLFSLDYIFAPACIGDARRCVRRPREAWNDPCVVPKNIHLAAGKTLALSRPAARLLYSLQRKRPSAGRLRVLTYLLLPARQSFASPRSDFGQRTSLAFDDLAAARAADAQRRALVSDPAAGSPRRRRRAS